MALLQIEQDHSMTSAIHRLKSYERAKHSAKKSNAALAAGAKSDDEGGGYTKPTYGEAMAHRVIAKETTKANKKAARTDLRKNGQLGGKRKKGATAASATVKTLKAPKSKADRAARILAQHPPKKRSTADQARLKAKRTRKRAAGKTRHAKTAARKNTPEYAAKEDRRKAAKASQLKTGKEKANALKAAKERELEIELHSKLGIKKDSTKEHRALVHNQIDEIMKANDLVKCADSNAGKINMDDKANADATFKKVITSCVPHSKDSTAFKSQVTLESLKFVEKLLMREKHFRDEHAAVNHQGEYGTARVPAKGTTGSTSVKGGPRDKSSTSGTSGTSDKTRFLGATNGNIADTTATRGDSGTADTTNGKRNTGKNSKPVLPSNRDGADKSPASSDQSVDESLRPVLTSFLEEHVNEQKTMMFVHLLHSHQQHKQGMLIEAKETRQTGMRALLSTRSKTGQQWGSVGTWVKKTAKGFNDLVDDALDAVGDLAIEAVNSFVVRRHERREETRRTSLHLLCTVRLLLVQEAWTSVHIL